MSEISRAALFGKLNPLGYKAIEAATVFCKLRGNPYVEIVHWLHQLLQEQDSDLHRIVKHFEIDPSVFAKDIIEALDRLPRGATSLTDLSQQVEDAVERGWVYGTLLFGESQVRTGHLIVGMLKTPSLRNTLNSISAQPWTPGTCSAPGLRRRTAWRKARSSSKTDCSRWMILLRLADGMTCPALTGTLTGCSARRATILAGAGCGLTDRSARTTRPAA